MDYMSTDIRPDQRQILCCECGVGIQPNPANMCVACLRSRVDITEGIPKQATLHFCRGCERYLQPPSEWIACALESRELLSLCLKKLKGLNRVKLIDATFVWTEPHSKRLKVKLTVHGEVAGGVVLEQVFIVEYLVNHQMCEDCHRNEAQDYWKALVQVRQKSIDKKTFFYLEQLILKYKAHDNTLGIKPIHEGLDFFYANESQARKMVDFINGMLPCRYQHSKKLISHDIHSNTYNYKFTYSIEIVPISKDNVVCLPKKLTQQLGGISPLCLVLRVSNALHLIDPTTAQIAEVSGSTYWRYPFNSICSSKQLVEYVVMDIENVLEKDRKVFPGQGAISSRHVLADVWVVKASELGINENTIHAKTHLGHLLKPGDSVLGYNIGDSNVNDANYEKVNKDHIPDVILVKKHFGDRVQRKKNRVWKLRHLAEDNTAFNPDSNDYHEFLDDLEEDPALRQNINIYKDEKRLQGAQIDPNLPMISLEEMMDDLVIDDCEMQEAY